MAKYIVNVIMTASVDVEVEAPDEDEARLLAVEEADIDAVDGWDCEVDGVFRQD